MRLILAAVLFPLTLAGCGGGSEPTPPKGIESKRPEATPPAAKTEPQAEELKKLEGTWEVVSQIFNGTTQPQPRGGMRLVIQGDRYSWQALGETFEKGRLQVDPTKRPAALDRMPEVGRDKGRTFLCIYEWNGDTFRYCQRPSGGLRPTEFAAEPGTGLEVVALRRAKGK